MRVPNGTQIYLKFGGKIKVPVNPEEINITKPSKNETFEVLGKGEIVVPKPSALSEVSFSSFVTVDRTAPYSNGGASPSSFVTKMQKAMDNHTKGRLIISRAGLLNTNMSCIVEEFTTTDKGGEPDDIYYTIKLREYRNYGAQQVTIAQPTLPTASSDSTSASSDTTQAIATADRPVETPTLRVGAPCIANGDYCYDSYGSNPHGVANNLSTTVKRIVTGAPYPILIGSYGWVQESQLQITG